MLNSRILFALWFAAQRNLLVGSTVGIAGLVPAAMEPTWAKAPEPAATAKLSIASEVDAYTNLPSCVAPIPLGTRPAPPIVLKIKAPVLSFSSYCVILQEPAAPTTSWV